MRALHDSLRPRPKLIIAGTDPAALAALRRRATGRYRLDCYVLGATSKGLPGLLDRFRTERPVTAWLCRGMQCLPPVESGDELDRLMSDTED